MATEDRFRRLKTSSAKGAKVAAVVAILAAFTSTSLLRAFALSATIVLFFALPSFITIVVNSFSERRSVDSNQSGPEIANDQSNTSFLRSIPKAILLVASGILLIISLLGEEVKFLVCGTLLGVIGLLIRAPSRPTGLAVMLSIAAAIGGCSWLILEIGNNFR